MFNRLFFDDMNFPQGFRRCGVFTIREAEYLQENGTRLKALAYSESSPETDEESEFVLRVNDAQLTSLFSVRVWRKYITAIEQKRHRIYMSEYSSHSSKEEMA